MKLKGILLEKNIYKNGSYIYDFLSTENNLISFKAKGTDKTTSANKYTLFFLNIIEGEFIKKGNKYLFLNGKVILDSNFYYDSYYGLIFLNAVKELIYKIMKKQDWYKISRNLVFIQLINSRNTSKPIVYIYSLVYLSLLILQTEGLDFFIFLKSQNLDDLLYKKFKDPHDLKNVEINTNELKEVLKNINTFIEENFNSKINSFDLFLEHL